MAREAQPCPTHQDWLQCPDRAVFRGGRFAFYLKRGGADTAFLLMNYCPWCSAKLSPAPDEDGWIDVALAACLEAVATDTIWIAPDRVTVLRSWIEGPHSFCVVYQHPWSDAIHIGYRAVYSDGQESSFDTTNPTLFGQFAADNILEPLGSVRERLRFDDQGVGWHGRPLTP